uniref:FAM86 N-terminal domain-containing protein n=1 Tax=Strigamia maritima TaxID=126957 RepID=T1IN19_STRMM
MESVKNFCDEMNISYSTCCDTNLINWHLQNSSEENSNIQIDIINATVKHPLCVKYPPPLKYRKKFIKTLIYKIEETKLEVIEELYEIYLKLINESDDDVSYKTYYSKKYDVGIKLEESNNLISNATTGLTTWEASFYLTDWCLANKNIFYKKKVLELGCGIGFTGIALSLCCKPSLYCFTDAHETVLEQVDRNIDINIRENCKNFELPSVEVIKLDWTDDTWEMKDYDVLLAADIVYDPQIIPYLVRTLDKLLNNIPIAYIAEF